MRGNAKFDLLLKTIENQKDRFIDRLRKAVCIKSVSSDESLRGECMKMADFLVLEMRTLGFTQILMKDLGIQPPPVNNPNLKLPPVILGKLFSEKKKKKTILVYGHYDVQPALKSDGWLHDPFIMNHDLNLDVLYGRGTSDDKGPLLGWLNVVEAHKILGIEFPVNLIVCFEGMEESGSLKLSELISNESNSYFKDVDNVTISDNYWLSNNKPSLSHGLRGCSYYQVTIEGPKSDLHSGIFGGAVAEPMTDLINIMSKLVSSQGKILIPGIYEMVPPISDKENSIFDKIDYSIEEFETLIGSKTSLHSDHKQILKSTSKYPSLSLHGIEGAFHDPGAKTVIPAKVTGKFSIRTVPNIDLLKLDEIVFNYIKTEFEKLSSPNKISVNLIHSGNYWYQNPFNASFTAASKAINYVWKTDPDLIIEGGSIPITLDFSNYVTNDVLLLPMGRRDDNPHSTNEKLNVNNYIEGCKVFCVYLHLMSESLD